MSLTRRIRWLSWALVGVLVSGCADGLFGRYQVETEVVENPYAGVDWASAQMLKVQLHDHVGVDTGRIRSYDSAGYSGLALVQYSGVPSLGYTWLERRWPAERWLPASFLSSLTSISLLVPGGEEVGFDHVVSPLLTEQIVKRDDGLGGLTYGSTQEAIDLIELMGGIAVVAHPWAEPKYFAQLRGYTAIEVYSAFAAGRRRQGDPTFVSVDRNELMKANWDVALRRDPRVRGIAVNDHFGPDREGNGVPPDVRDSGKILVLSRPASGNELRQIVRSGAFFAVVDTGVVKDLFPRVEGIVATDSTIEILTDGVVRWVANGRRVGQEGSLTVRRLGSVSYVRAEVSKGPVTLLSQAFPLGPLTRADPSRNR